MTFQKLLLIKILTIVLVFLSFQLLNGQHLKPGFNPNEYSEFLRITARQRGPIPDTLFPTPIKYDQVYNSPSVGMDNGWQLWVSNEKANFRSAVLSIRATTSHQRSWFENLYSYIISDQ